MLLLYNFGVRLYYFFILLASAKSKKAQLWIKGRENIFDHITKVLKPGEQRIWVHCASLGEFEQGRPIIEAIKEQHPDLKIVLTFFSPSGYEVRKNYPGADYIFYLPLDTNANAKRFVNLIRPQFAIFIKYEFWYHYLTRLHKQNIPVYIASAIFRPSQVFFKWYGGLFRKVLKNITHIFVQNEASAVLLNNIGISHVSVSGDTRFDRVYTICQHVKPIPLVEKFKSGSKILIAGSTWEADENIIAGLDLKSFDKVKLIIAPHEINENNIEKLISKLNIYTPADRIIRFSKAEISTIDQADILIIDNIGMLSSLYSYGHWGYIGGGFGKGIHNILEAATFGLPVFFGPNYNKFQEAKDLVELGAAFSINIVADLQNKLVQIDYGHASATAKNYVAQKTGGTQIILERIFS